METKDNELKNIKDVVLDFLEILNTNRKNKIYEQTNITTDFNGVLQNFNCFLFYNKTKIFEIVHVSPYQIMIKVFFLNINVNCYFNTKKDNSILYILTEMFNTKLYYDYLLSTVNNDNTNDMMKIKRRMCLNSLNNDFSFDFGDVLNIEFGYDENSYDDGLIY